MSNIVIVVEGKWKNMGTVNHPWKSKQFECVMYKVDDASHGWAPNAIDGDVMWIYSIGSFKRRFKDLIEQYMDEYGCTMKEFEDALYCGILFERIESA